MGFCVCSCSSSLGRRFYRVPESPVRAILELHILPLCCLEGEPELGHLVAAGRQLGTARREPIAQCRCLALLFCDAPVRRLEGPVRLVVVILERLGKLFRRGRQHGTLARGSLGHAKCVGP